MDKVKKKLGRDKDGKADDEAGIIEVTSWFYLQLIRRIGNSMLPPVVNTDN